MIKVKVKDKESKESSFITFKRATSFTLRKYRSNLYFHKKKRG